MRRRASVREEKGFPGRDPRTRRLVDYAELHHLPAAGMVLLAATGFSAAASRGYPPIERLLPFLGAVLLTQLAIAYHNDYCDAELDAQTKPWRPIPRGVLSPREALGLSAALTALGLLAAVPLGFPVVMLVALGTGAGFAYNGGLKRTALSWLPFWVALPTLVVCAYAVVGLSMPAPGVAYVLGAPLALAIYLADTLPDVELDARLAISGAAHRLGPRGARLVCWGSLAFAQGLAVLVWPAGRPPGLPFGLSVVLLGLAVILGWRKPRRVHFLVVTASAILLALDWLYAMAATGR